jgi:glycyl-tRNA synthetase beta subunit
MEETPITNRQLRDFTDRLESLHSRMDSFFAWAGVLQKEYRAMQQRVAFLESQCALDMGQAAQESELLDRLKAARQGHNPP